MPSQGMPRRQFISSIGSSLASSRTSSVAPYCNLAKFGLELLSPDLELPLSTCRQDPVISVVESQRD